MNIQALHHVRRFRSQPVGLAGGRIDVEAGIIHDVVMVEEGPAKGHGVHLDADFVENLVAYDRANFAERGVKARLGHPDMCSDAQGTQLGFFRNIRKRKQGDKMQAIGDLHLLDAADLSPSKPNARAWALQMAAEAPDFFMSSIVFVGSGYYQRKGNKHKKPVLEEADYDAELPLFVEFDAEKGAAHYNTDLVEDGAATSSLFSTGANPHLFVSRVHDFLDDNPEVFQFAQANPDRVQELLLRLGIAHTTPTAQKKMSKFSLIKCLYGEPQEADPTPDDLTQLGSELSTVKDSLSALTTEVSDLTTERDALTVKVSDLTTQLSAAQAEVARLGALPAAPPTGGDTPGTATAEPKAYDTDPITVRARALRAAAQKQQ